MVNDGAVPDRSGAMALASHGVRDGDWLLPRFFRAAAVMGEMVVDLTRVRLGAGVSHIDAVAVMGQVTIRVPHNLRLECDGQPVLGSVETKRAVESVAMPDAPMIRITGRGFMGAIIIKVVDPNAKGWRARWKSR
jgi:hypothetical protein